MAWIAVSTYLKTPQRQVSEDAAAGPIGFNDAFFNAVRRLGDLGLTDDRVPRNALIESEQEQADFDGTDAGTLGPDWSAEDSIIDDQVHQSMTRRINGAWATLVDLPAVAVAISGPESMSAVARSISDVSARLDDYVH